MSPLSLTSVNYSLSEQPKSLDEWKTHLIQEIHSFLKSSPQVILYPELFLMGLTSYLGGTTPEEELALVADYVSQKLVPDIAREFQESEALIVLGTAPRKVGQKIVNSAPVICRNRVIYQDKLNLTPWETYFTAGEELTIFKFLDLKVAIVICFDIEQPLLAHTLKKAGVDLILVPSATTNMNGSQRVNRCASARAVELGAAVLTSLLVGDSYCDLVDHNEGHQGFYLPAQDAVIVPQEEVSAYSSSHKVIGRYQVDLKILKNIKVPSSETMPYLKVENEPRVKLIQSLY